MINQGENKKMVYRLIWGEIDKEIIAIKAVGNYNEFVDYNYNLSTTDFYNPKTNKLRSYKELIIDELDNGKCVFYKNHLIFKEGYETEYKKYASNYIKSLSSEDLKLFYSLKEKSNFSKIKSYLNMFKLGVLKEPFIKNILKENLINNNLLEQLI